MYFGYLPHSASSVLSMTLFGAPIPIELHFDHPVGTIPYDSLPLRHAPAACLINGNVVTRLVHFLRVQLGIDDHCCQDAILVLVGVSNGI